VQALPSLHVDPSGFTGFEHQPLMGSQDPASWHASGAAQVTGLPWQDPARQASPLVHALKSKHAVPSGSGDDTHWPVVWSQVSAVWQACRGWQVLGTPPWQIPATHVSTVVQASPSVQAVPSGLGGLTQAPVSASHVPASWHASPGHVTEVPAQAPSWQRSPVVQASPS
jgi:hypothetical protein